MRELTIDEAVAWTGGHLAECGFFFDFDGTLAPIQDDPEAVALPPAAHAPLAELAKRAGRTAVISARPMGFLAGRLGHIAGLRLYGLYGLESSVDGGRTVTTLPAAEPYAEVFAGVVREARLAFPKALIEDKRLSCALHFRTTPESAEPMLAWAAARAERDGLRVQHGRMVVELKPPVDWDKGAAVRAALPGLAGAWYFGDDLGDIPAFAALKQAVADSAAGSIADSAAGSSSVPGAESDRSADCLRGFRVAVTSAESDRRLVEQSQYQVDGPAQVPVLLERIIAASQ